MEAMLSELAWIQEDEVEGIAAVHATLKKSLPDWPDNYPSDFSHDLVVARFLRGNGNSTEAASKAMLRR